VVGTTTCKQPVRVLTFAIVPTVESKYPLLPAPANVDTEPSLVTTRIALLLLSAT
jgi:hypothetical protein